MAFPETARAAPACADRDPRNIEQLGGPFDLNISPLPLADQAARRLAMRFGLSLPVAVVIAIHAGLGERRAAP